jgi:outer membrane protein OmpA-like peptidoglycan-associated protein
MRKLIILLLTGELFGIFYPGEIGFRTISPVSNEPTFSIVGVRVAPGEANRFFTIFDNYFGLSYPLSKRTSLYLGAPILMDRTEDSTLYGFGDLELGLKFRISDNAGLYPFLHPALRENKRGIVRFFSSGSFDYGVIFLYKTNLGNFSLFGNLGAVNWLNNAGYSYYGDQVLIRLTLLKPFKDFEPFIELSYDWFIFQSMDIGPFKRDTAKLYGGSPGRISLGSHINIGRDWKLSLGGTLYWSKRKIGGVPPESTFVLVSGDIPFEVNVGLSYSFNLKERDGRVMAKGRVLDAETGEGIPADIYVEGTDLHIVANEKGEFFLSSLPSGIYRIVLNAPGYREEKRLIALLEEKSFDYTILMEKMRERKGWISIKLEDSFGSPIEAEVIFDGEKFMTDRSGLLNLEIEPGIHRIIAEPSGYEGIEREVFVDEGDTLTLPIKLSPKKFPVLYFPRDSYELPDEEIDLLKEVAEYLKNNPEVEVEIVGYSSSDGPEDYNLILSEKRAQSVKEILVSIFGIDSKRLRTKGEGERNPIASNETPSGRAKNRRVVFNIISR